MRIATYNVNGINGRLANLLGWLQEAAPDIVCLQELKAPDDKFPAAALRAAGYGAVWHGQKSWNGVAILARGAEPVETRRGLPGDPDDTHSRYIEAAIGGMVVGCLYLPNGNPVPGPKFDYKPGACHCDWRTSNAVGDLQHLCGALANHNACRHSVAGRHAGHNGRVRDPEILEPVHSEFAVHNRCCIPAHPGRAALVPIADSAVPDKVLQFEPLEVSRHHLPPCEGTQVLRVAYFAAKRDAGQRGLDVVGMR